MTASSGAAGYLLYEPETTAGVFVPPTNTMWATSATPTNTADQIIRSYYAGNRAAETGLQPGKVVLSGQFVYPLFPNVGMLWWKHAFGKAAYMTALAADTTTGTATTVGGLTTMVLTSGAAYTPGAWVLIGTGAAKEPGRVVSYVAGTKTLVVAGLQLPANLVAVAGTAVLQPAQHKFSPLLNADAGHNTLPTMSFEFNKGTYSEQYAGTYVGGLMIAGAAQDVTSTLTLEPTVYVGRPGSPTAFAPSATESGDQSKFYTINQGYVVGYADPSVSGVSTQQVMKTVESWQFDIANNQVQKRYWNGNRFVTSYPTIARASIQYVYVNEAQRNVEWEDFINTSLWQDIPFFVSLASNSGVGATKAAPVWNAFGVYVPSTRLLSAPDTNPIGDLQTITVTGRGDGATGLDLAQVFVMNSKATSY